ncbi:MAG TPA: SIMPL domain-containing protein [Gemmatimonadaceae bacterium]|nr:SIMPL domain-containing protein [Gemmatimonadaceae bacterium]
MRVVAFVVCLVIACQLHAQQDERTASNAHASNPTITASGHGEARVTPDRATLSIGVETKGATAAQASAENARKQRAVVAGIKALGVSDAQISTVDFSVYPEQRVPTDKPDEIPRIVGYTVTNTVRIDVQRLDQVGPLIDAALGKGANAINSLSFFSSDEDEARRSALMAAVQRARGDAEAMAKGAGGRLGDIIDVTSQTGTGPVQPFAARMSLQAASTPINPGTQTVSADVVASWQFIRE